MGKTATKLVVVIDGGMISEVYATDETIDVTCIDMDTDDPDEYEEQEKALEKVQRNKRFHEIEF